MHVKLLRIFYIYLACVYELLYNTHSLYEGISNLYNGGYYPDISLLKIKFNIQYQ